MTTTITIDSFGASGLAGQITAELHALDPVTRQDTVAIAQGTPGVGFAEMGQSARYLFFPPAPPAGFPGGYWLFFAGDASGQQASADVPGVGVSAPAPVAPSAGALPLTAGAGGLVSLLVVSDSATLTLTGGAALPGTATYAAVPPSLPGEAVGDAGDAGGPQTGWSWDVSGLAPGTYGGVIALTTGAVTLTLDVAVSVGGEAAEVSWDWGDNLPTAAPGLPGRPWRPGARVWVRIAGAYDAGTGEAVAEDALLSLTPSFVFADGGGNGTDPLAGEVVSVGGADWARCEPASVQPDPDSPWPAGAVSVWVDGSAAGWLDVWG